MITLCGYCYDEADCEEVANLHHLGGKVFEFHGTSVWLCPKCVKMSTRVLPICKDCSGKDRLFNLEG